MITGDGLNFVGPPGYPAGALVPKMKAEGNGSSGVFAIAEALGQHESEDRLPLRPYAEAGSVFQSVLRHIGLDRDQLTLSNLVWYQPPRNYLEGAPWQSDAIQLCRPLNDELIRERYPKVILALGGMAFRELTGLAGEKQGIEMCRGFICPSLTRRTEWIRDGMGLRPIPVDVPWPSLPVIGTYHPSFLRRGAKEREKAPEGAQGRTVAAGGGTQGMNLLGVLIRDLKLCLEVASSGVPLFKYDDYKLEGTLDDWRNALAFLQSNPELPVVYDFETLDSLVRESEEDAEHLKRDVTQVQISWRTGQALVSTWFPDLLPVLREILHLPNPKIDWNGRKFDRPICREMGIRCDIGQWIDLMDCWHHAQPDLPRGLQFATSFVCPEVGPWKHFATSDALKYGAFDVDMPQRIYAALKRTLSMIRDKNSGISLWGDGKYGGFTGQVLNLSPVLDAMTERGIPVDEDQRCKLDEQFSRTLGRSQYQEYLKDHGLPLLEAEEAEKIEGIADRLQGLIPDEVKSVDPPKGYKTIPKELTSECPTCHGKKTVVDPEWTPKPRKGKKSKKTSSETSQSCEFPENLDKFFELASNEGSPYIETVKTVETVRTKRIPCGNCGGMGRVPAETVPPGWVRRLFQDLTKCRCVKEANQRIARAKRDAKKALKALQKAAGIVEVTESEKTDSDFGRPGGTEEWTGLLHCEECHGTGKLTVREERWSRLAPFLPNGPAQVMRYVKLRFAQEEEDLTAKFEAKVGVRMGVTLEDFVESRRKWRIPTDYKTGSETTSEAELRRLAAKTMDPVLPMILEFREVAKLRGTYVKGWAPSGIQEFVDPDTELVRRIGRVHPVFGYRPATGQLSSENPNAQNFPSHSELSHAMLKMISSRPRFRMVKFDFKSFHAITAGFEAQDKDWIRIARVDIHSFLTLVGLLKLEKPEVAFGWSPAELKDRLKWYRKDEKCYSTYARQKHPGGMTFGEIRDEIAKRVVYGWEFGQGERSLYMLNPESFSSIGEAGRFQKELVRLFPKIDRWQGEVRLEADRNHCLTSRYGYIRRFWEVFSHRRVQDNYEARMGEHIYLDGKGNRWVKKPGADHEAVVAFRPANSAFGMKRQALVKLGEQGLDVRYGLISETHDDFRFECPVELIEEMVPVVKGIMEEKSSYLIDPVVAPDGLWCETDLGIGKDWDSLEKVA
jgi:uracil-DNA glycosylase family 4